MSKISENELLKFEKKSPREHILIRPDTYVGSCTPAEELVYVLEGFKDSKNLKVVEKKVIITPAFLKVFDEILTNASDHRQRDKTLTKIEVEIFGDRIIVENNGTGIPVEKHPVYDSLIPEMIFGELLTGTNYDDSEKRFGGGRNGYGSKLTNVFSKKFKVETHDGKNSFKGTWTENMSEKEIEPVKESKKSFTKITFWPDFEKFGMTEITEPLMEVLARRVLDIAAYNPQISVYLNGIKLPVKTFRNYVEMHVEESQWDEILYEKIDDHFEVALVPGTEVFKQNSMVNGIYTSRGGTHVNYILDQITDSLKVSLEKKHKGIKIRPWDIKGKMWIFVNAQISNPAFDTQTKETLKTPSSGFEGNPKVSEKFIKKILNSEIVESINRWIQAKEASKLKSLNKSTWSKIKVEKLHDAPKAGGDEADKCALILTEGDSAKTGALSGLSSVDGKYFGVYPLRGKVLNVREAQNDKIINHKELAAVITALGLVPGKKYPGGKGLRYGKLILMTDADVDGIHIKGLLINAIHWFWPELLQGNFLYEFITPVMKAKKGKLTESFYNLGDYEKWKEVNGGWSIKYYKGLGTSSPDEMREYFKDLDKHLIPLVWKSDTCGDKIDMAFRKDRVGDRKTWLNGNVPGQQFPEKFGRNISFEEFIDEDLIQFSHADNFRSIPHLVDGLKPSQRKILYTCLKRNITSDIKVSQLSGSVSELTSYHHGEMSLQDATIGLAQDFVGSNNLNLLEPSGQFGSRLHGGKDSAAARYVFTRLSDSTKDIFKSEDSDILNYLQDDGKEIEPEYFVPIIPMILVNGTEGIGTGYSTYIPKANPLDIIHYIENKLDSKKLKPLPLYFNNFKGEVFYRPETDRWITRGIIKELNATNLHIQELPVGMWNEKYQEHLDKLQDQGTIKSWMDLSNEQEINIHIQTTRAESVNYNPQKLIEIFKLETDFALSNMTLWYDGKLKKYDSFESIVEDFCKVRLDFYNKRKKNLLEKLEYEKDLATEKVRFIKMVLSKDLVIEKRSMIQIHSDLKSHSFKEISGSWDYLLRMPLVQLSAERIEELEKSAREKSLEFEILQKTTIEELWKKDLSVLKSSLNKKKSKI